MHIFWIILTECLLALIDFLTMKFIKKRGFMVFGIDYGFKPILYNKTINNFKFTLGIIPFFGGLVAYDLDVKSHTPKFLNTDVYGFLCRTFFPFLLAFTLMIVLLLSFCGLDSSRITLQILFLFDTNLIDKALIFLKLDTLPELIRLPISISVYVVFIYLYAGVLRSLIDLVLEKVLKITSQSAQYVVTTILLFIIIDKIPNAFFGHLLNFSTLSPYMLLDWFIGHCIFIVIAGLIIEIMARRQPQKLNYN